jgi:hypothetical protein
MAAYNGSRSFSAATAVAESMSAEQKYLFDLNGFIVIRSAAAFVVTSTDVCQIITFGVLFDALDRTGGLHAADKSSLTP